MTWTRLGPRLEPQVTVKTLPLPFLLPALNLLSAPVTELAEELKSQLGSNVLAAVVPPPGIGQASETEVSIETLPAAESLEETLARQLYLLPALKSLSHCEVRLLIRCLDSKGYLDEDSLGPFLDSTGLSPAGLDELLPLIQDWVDPPGLFARNLVECLIIQLRRSGLQGSDAWRVLTEGEPYLLRKDLDALCAALGWTRQRLRLAMNVIRRLDPRPGSPFDRPSPVIPEIAFEPAPGGSALTVRLLHENLPRFTLENDLLAYVEQSPFREQWGQVKNLMTALALRLRTKLRTARLLAERQQAFLLGASGAPGPLVLRDLAAGLDYHPSTIHRALSTTWARSPRGTLRLSSLLSRPLRARRDLSVAQFRQALAKGKSMGKSDSRLAMELKIPRRTLAWHRRKMGL